MMTMKMIGLISDTHGWLDPQVHEVFKDASHIIHAGDIGKEEVIHELEQIAPVVVVKGNIDGGDLRFYPLEATLEIGPTTIVTRHIAGSPTRPNADTRKLLQRVNPQVIVVGHSHIFAVARVMGALWLNPGAAGIHGFHIERTAMRLFVHEDSGELKLERVSLGPRIAQP